MVVATGRAIPEKLPKATLYPDLHHSQRFQFTQLPYFAGCHEAKNVTRCLPLANTSYLAATHAASNVESAISLHWSSVVNQYLACISETISKQNICCGRIPADTFYINIARLSDLTHAFCEPLPSSVDVQQLSKSSSPKMASEAIPESLIFLRELAPRPQDVTCTYE